MCGITGFCTTPGNLLDERILVSMRDSLIHRGPDHSGLHVSKNQQVGLAHTRLSIIDLSSNGHQPMSNEAGDVWIAYNGEIYNFKEIKKNLTSKGHQFRSETDTEVVVHAYEQYGLECLHLFNGMFAFVIYDEQINTLFIARDRFGIKPLYYTTLTDGSFAFASEVKSILAHPAFERTLDYSSVGDYFNYRYIPSPRSIWRGIRKLEPGHYVVFDLASRQLDLKRYYSLTESIKEKSYSTIEDVEGCLVDAVKSRLVSDVEIGTLLSGGLDSSTITALAKSMHPEIKAFSIGFSPTEYSELDEATYVANYLGVFNQTKIIDNIDEDVLENLPLVYDEPLADSSCIPTFILCQMVSSHVKVALSGDGGDEVFSGYNWYSTYLTDFTQFQNSFITRIKRLFGRNPTTLPNFESYYSKLLLNRFNDSVLEQLLSPEIFADYKRNKENLYERYINTHFNGVKVLRYIDLNTFLVDDILTKVDRSSMANSLEIRVPMLDHRLVESVFSLPESEFRSDATGKPILKNIMATKLPMRTISRPKKGFSAPATKWTFYSKFDEYILEGQTVKDGLFNKSFIVNVLNGNYHNGEGILWMIYVFERWFQKWIATGIK